MLMTKIITRFMALLAFVASVPVWSHDPVFGFGPHVLFKDGVEISPQYKADKAGDNETNELSLELTYGLTGDWSAGIDIPYVDKSDPASSESGQGDLAAFTKYRFWRGDGPGVQQSTTALIKVITDSGDDKVSTGTTDSLLALAYGYESRRWYRWAALRHRFNDEDDAGLRRGNKTLFDLVAGIRMKRTGYLEPDTVWLLELNGEFAQRAELNGAEQMNTGGTEWFVSPGIFWTLRNFAVKAGVQIPVASDLNERQEKTDYRAKVVLEWHL